MRTRLKRPSRAKTTDPRARLFRSGPTAGGNPNKACELGGSNLRSAVVWSPGCARGLEKRRILFRRSTNLFQVDCLDERQVLRRAAHHERVATRHKLPAVRSLVIN